MPRPNRHDLPEFGAYHLTMRGVDGCDIYRDDDDRTHFVRLLALGTRLADWRLLAYCLMRNHFHLVASRAACTPSPSATHKPSTDVTNGAATSSRIDSTRR
jgi:hypothetical protein